MAQAPIAPATQITYQSPDLELFAEANNWKRYWSNSIGAYIKGRVVEVGAGLGVSTEYMVKPEYPEWICLEPDPSFAAHLARRIERGELPRCCSVKCGILTDLTSNAMADTILYIDVLEHVEDDEGEMRAAASHLKRGGHVVVLSPAFNFLYSQFDRAVGHYRRYHKADIKRLTPPDLTLETVFCLDSIGFFASLANRLLLKSSMPTSAQVALWDRVMVPLSRYTDRFFGTMFGKTIVAVWRKV
jgi:SAM-dependent methyltransferase